VAYFDRDAFINEVLDLIKTTGIMAGDHIAPKEGGWSSGQPGKGTYVGYTALFSGNANFTASVFCPGDYDCQMQFSTRTFGTTRKQADDLARLVRSVLVAVKPDAGEYRTNLLYCSQIGANERMDDTEPKRWRVVDTYSVSMVPSVPARSDALKRKNDQEAFTL